MTDVDPAAYDHYRPSDAADVPDGVYRVVGIADGTVTLLAVADAGDRRRHTGRLVRVPAARVAAEFEPADDPDAGIDPGGVLDRIRWLPRAVRDRLP